MQQTATRIPAPSANGTAAPRRKGKPGSSRAARVKAHAAARAARWAHRYTAGAIVLSAGLNAYAAVTGCHSDAYAVQTAAGLLGASIPVLVWVLGTVTAWTYRAGWRRLAAVSGTVAACVLALSVLHVAAALGALTGSHWLLAGLLAVGIDCGLVSSEATAILVTAID